MVKYFNAQNFQSDEKVSPKCLYHLMLLNTTHNDVFNLHLLKIFDKPKGYILLLLKKSSGILIVLHFKKFKFTKIKSP